jgi:hypothetical protein
LRKAGCEEEAFFEFGIALHTLQDWTSPTHHGFQVWTRKATQYPAHIPGELMNPGEGSELYRVTLDAWKWFNERKLPPGDLFKYYGRDF